MTDNDINAETDEGTAGRGRANAEATWLPPKPFQHRQRTIWSLACTVVLLAVLAFSLTSVVCVLAPI